MAKNYTLVEIMEILSRYFSEMEDEIISGGEYTGLTQKQLCYLEAIRELKNPNFSELADKLKLSKPSITAIINKMEKNGYVRKAQSDEDRRSFHIHLTEKGMELSAAHDRIHKDFAEKFEAALSPDELSELTRLLNKSL